MPFSDSLITLAGFVLAHAAWSVSDLPQGDLLVPLAIVEKSGERQLLRFEADSQTLAIEKGKEILAQHDKELDQWAFAREGQVSEDSHNIDVLTVEAKARGVSSSVVFVQRFQPYSTGRFRLVGAPAVVIDGKSQSEEQAKPYLDRLYAGVQSHSKAAEHWREWSKP